jgi:ferritin
MSNISVTSLKLLNEQIANEMFNSNVYRFLGSYLKKLGIDNIGDFFYKDQVSEEHGHAQLISDYINDRNETVLSLPVPDAYLNITSLTNLAELYLAREQDTTSKLSAIAQQALSEGDFMLYDFMLEMIRKQRNEENEALTFVDRAYMANNDWKTWLLWDAGYNK